MSFVELELISKFTPFGVRFLDPALDVQIREGLEVRAWPAGRVHEVRHAWRTRSDVYALGGLPGLRELENGFVADDVVSPPRTFVVHVRDRHDRYLEVAFTVDLPLPYRGVFLSNCPTSPELGVNGFLLLSSPVRRSVSWLAGVRGNLLDADRFDPAQPDVRPPAAHAMVRVRTSAGSVHYGAADASGAFRVMLPYPPFDTGFGGSPVVSGGVPLGEREWPIEIDVHYEPARTAPLPGLQVPDYCELLRQQRAEVFQDITSPSTAAASEWHGNLRFGRELVVRTGDLPELWVRAASSSP